MEERQVKSPEQACFYSSAVGPVVRTFNFQLVFKKLQARLSTGFLWDFQSAYNSTQFRYPCPYYIQTTTLVIHEEGVFFGWGLLLPCLPG